MHGMVHVTGGGFWENVPRVLVDDTHAACIDMDSWRWPEVFAWMQQAGNIETSEMLKTFNCGIGFILVVAEDQAEAVTRALTEAGEAPLTIGSIVPHDTEVSASQFLAR